MFFVDIYFTCVCFFFCQIMLLKDRKYSVNNIFTGTPEGEDAKSRKRRRSSLSFLEQWMWGGKRRSARVRSTVKRETEKEDGNLQEALRRLVPPSLL